MEERNPFLAGLPFSRANMAPTSLEPKEGRLLFLGLEDWLTNNLARSMDTCLWSWILDHMEIAQQGSLREKFLKADEGCWATIKRAAINFKCAMIFDDEPRGSQSRRCQDVGW